MYIVESIAAERFMETWLIYSSFSQALSLAKEYGFNDGDCLSLIQAEAEIKKKIKLNNEKIIRRMPDKVNIAKITDNWFGIRYIEKDGRHHLSIDPLVEQELSLVIDSSRINLTRWDIDNLIQGIVDRMILEEFKKDVRKKAVELLNEYLGINAIDEPQINVTETIYRVTGHTAKRWAERIMKIKDKQRVNEYELNPQLIEANILEQFYTAKIVWVDDDGAEYYFDDNNIFYVIRGNVIVTIYEKDFNLPTKELNRKLTLDMIKYLKSKKKELKKIEREFQKVEKQLDDKLFDLASQILVAEDSLNKLYAIQQNLVDEKIENFNQFEHEQQSYNKEYEKIFKKWHITA